MRWSAHTALLPAVAAAGSPAECPAAPACDGAWSGLLAPWGSERSVTIARPHAEPGIFRSRCRLFRSDGEKPENQFSKAECVAIECFFCYMNINTAAYLKCTLLAVLVIYTIGYTT